MTEPVWDCGYLSLAPEIQAALEAPPPESDRIRIEIVADELGVTARIDYEADMAYIRVRYGKHFRTSAKQEDNSLILDYDDEDNLLGIEIFLVGAAIRPVTFEKLKELLGG